MWILKLFVSSDRVSNRLPLIPWTQYQKHEIEPSQVNYKPHTLNSTNSPINVGLRIISDWRLCFTIGKWRPGGLKAHINGIGFLLALSLPQRVETRGAMATGTAASYPPPPPYYRLYSDYLTDPDSAPPPPPPIEGAYPLYSSTYTVRTFLFFFFFCSFNYTETLLLSY